MEREIAFAVKIEILRNVLKTHNIILVLGWPGTGKTVSSLKAALGLWKTYYFNAAGALKTPEPGYFNEGAELLGSLNELPMDSRQGSLLIIDDYDAASEDIMTAVKNLISERNLPGKIIITAQARTKLDEGSLPIEAVVRMKDETAEILYTNLRNLT